MVQEKLCVISIRLNFLGCVLWPKVCSILMNVLCELENKNDVHVSLDVAVASLGELSFFFKHFFIQL